ncbi:hypothetical protein J0B03_07885 [Alkalibacter rhizosphaerae]|uniref:Acyl-ACP thioesterase n=1 Tax=Alkalibacter rhizosphaerae TaxID=2815577 RepID=A0A974XG89_9FIRM|nr:acyl-ACP thioesterase domain-containing protein [Alkalibacter rhizosphaerae]QSX07743.1 hypothetical protein J0B03_07885 [Alkalibacter rhizosphaerae]
MAGYQRTEIHRIKSYEVDKNQRLHLERLVNYAQDIAMAQGESMGIGQGHLTDQGLAWVIVKFDIRLDRYPLYNEEIHVTTQPVGFHKLTADRRFWFADRDQKTLGTIASQWVMVDINKGRMKSIPEFYPKQYGFDFANNEKIVYDKVQMPDSWGTEAKERVKFSDLDFNDHVNNGRYLRWIMDGFPEGFLDVHGVKRLQVSFKKEARLGEVVTLRTTLPGEDEPHSLVEMTSEKGESLVQGRIDWFKFSE